MNKKILYKALALSFLGLSSMTYSAPPPGYKLHWSDEFNGNLLNENDWAYRIDGKKYSKQKKENIVVENGQVKIQLKKEKSGDFDWSAGGIISMKRFGPGPGYYEVRAKLSPYKGWHDSFWTTRRVNSKNSDSEILGRAYENTRDTDRNWIEIDVMEHWGKLGPFEVTTGAIHWNFPKKKRKIQRKKHKLDFDLSEDFHTFAMELSPEYLIYYIDDKVVDMVDMKQYPHHPFHVWLSTIASNEPPSESETLFEYFRSYTIDNEAYQSRRNTIMAMLSERLEAPEAQLKNALKAR